jgi:Ser/Thr protein kinase RdoA (MazF antagonist)
MVNVGTSLALAPDPVLGARDVLLDPSFVTDLLAGSLGLDGPVDIAACELVRVKYRIGESLRVLYRITVDGDEALVAGRVFPDGGAARAFARSARQQVATGPLRPVLHHAQLDTAWWTFPNDRRLRGIESLVHPPTILPGFAAAATGWTSSQVVQLAPERSVTLRARDSAGATLAFVKAYAPGTTPVDDLARRYDAVAAALGRLDATLQAPRSLGHSTERRVLLLEPMPGGSWLDLSPLEARSALRRLGRCIATMHGIPASDLPAGTLPRFARLDLSRLVRAGELVGQARPDVAASARRLVSALAATAPADEPPVFLHGDCHPGNLLARAGSVALVDLDQAGTGPAAADLGSLCARLRHGGVLGERGVATSMELGAAFLDGYAEVRRLPSPASLRWHTAAALLGERALRAVNRVRRPALDRLDDLLQLGELVLRGEEPR